MLDRRSFIVGSCSRGACLTAAAALPPAWSGPTKGRHYGRALLTDPQGRPLLASALRPRVNYVFHYPYEATPVLLLDLGRPIAAQAMSTRAGTAYAWPGGVGARRSVVAYSAICAHQLVYPTREVSFISFRPRRAARGVQDELIHCCAEHSQYDPARGAEVLSGPALQPLSAVLLAHDAATDTLTAYGTMGGELYDEFFRKYEAKLALEVGARARQQVDGQAIVMELDKFCRNPIQC